MRIYFCTETFIVPFICLFVFSVDDSGLFSIAECRDLFCFLYLLCACVMYALNICPFRIINIAKQIKSYHEFIFYSYYIDGLFRSIFVVVGCCVLHTFLNSYIAQLYEL